MKLHADFILRTECAFTTVDSLNISMFKLPLKDYIKRLAESLVALVSANLVVCISTIYPLFSTTQYHGEYAAPTVRETVESPLALVVSGPTPPVIRNRVTV